MLVVSYVHLRVGSYEVQIATMSQLDRLTVDGVYVCGFISNYMLPKKTPWSLDPFLHPYYGNYAFIDGIMHIKFNTYM